MCQDLALLFSAGLLCEWGVGTMARWQGAGRLVFGVLGAEGPRMNAAGDQMWKETPGSGRRQHGHPFLQPSGISEAGLDENGQSGCSTPSPQPLRALPVW